MAEPSSDELKLLASTVTVSAALYLLVYTTWPVIKWRHTADRSDALVNIWCMYTIVFVPLSVWR